MEATTPGLLTLDPKTQTITIKYTKDIVTPGIKENLRGFISDRLVSMIEKGLKKEVNNPDAGHQ